MSERVEEARAQQEGEIRQRHLRIGLMGPIGAGKSKLSKVLGDAWGVTPIEEDFGKNPHLKDFYRYPEENSFKSQTWFLVRKIRQLESLTSGPTEIIDPAIEMDYLYAKVQHDIGWMTDREWQTYRMLYDIHTHASQVREPNIFVVINAPGDILTQRIRKRGREFELWMLDKKPEYLEKLQSAVSSWTWEASDYTAVIPVNSGEIDYVNRNQHREMVVSYVEDMLLKHLEGEKNYKGLDGAELILPIAKGQKT